MNRNEIIEMAIPIVESYNGNITIRGLHYRLVANGMVNDMSHYKKVCGAMTKARWEGLIEFDSFKDHERVTIGETDYDNTDPESEADFAKEQIKSWATSYHKNRWENQPVYPEVFIEKKALQGVFEEPCEHWNVALNPCKGYPSLTFQYDAEDRLSTACRNGKKPVILYFGDYDCSGEDIPRSIVSTISRMGGEIELKRIALTEEQVIDWGLPPAPTKTTDSRSKNWCGLGQVELDAVEPGKIQSLCIDAIEGLFDKGLYIELLEIERQEREEFKSILINDFHSLLD